jgi:hypothetical protein
MRVWIRGEPIALSDQSLLGVGGEARVYRAGDRAVKIYHALDQAALAQKLDKVARFPGGLPEAVIVPQDPVLDAHRRPIGFVMRAVEGARELLHLARRPYREGRISQGAVTALFRRMHAVLGSIHRARVIVGDLNDGNILFSVDEPDRRGPWLIDADSMQLDGHPCTVAHERFIDPRLYGVDLIKDPALSEETDWYAFNVLLFSTLLYVHPYGGTHAKLATMLRRAEASWSILRPDVRYPKAALHYRVLPDVLLDHFERVFDRGERETFPDDLLLMRWERCRCGLEHARSVCPDCARHGVTSMRPAIRHNGRCRLTPVFETEGRILRAALDDGRLCYVYDDGRGHVRREDGSIVLEQSVDPGTRFEISGRATWIGRGRKLSCVRKGEVVLETSTGHFQGSPMFAAGFRLEGEWLIALGSGSLMGKILEGQTWLSSGGRLGFGFYRAGLLTFYFLFRADRAGLTHVSLPPIEGRLIDASAVFDADSVLFSVSSEKNGRLTTRLALIGSDGRVMASVSGAPQSHRALASTRGKCVLGGRLLTTSDDGLVSLEIDRATGLIVEGKLFSDTEPFICAEDEILPGPNGSIYIVKSREISCMTLEGGQT